MKNITLNSRNCNILLSRLLDFTLDELKNLMLKRSGSDCKHKFWIFFITKFMLFYRRNVHEFCIQIKLYNALTTACKIDL